MPRMSKKRKQEWALFLNERNRITYNELCMNITVRQSRLSGHLRASLPEA